MRADDRSSNVVNNVNQAGPAFEPWGNNSERDFFKSQF